MKERERERWSESGFSSVGTVDETKSHSKNIAQKPLMTVFEQQMYFIYFYRVITAILSIIQN